MTALDEWVGTTQQGSSPSYDFAYDPYSRLASATSPGNAGQPSSESFAYDAAGNRDSASGYTHDAGNRMTDSATRHYEYDLDGNLTEIWTADETTQLAALQWDALNRLTSYTEYSGGSPGDVTTYAYDPFGRRLSKQTVSGTTQYLWSGDELTAEYGASARQVRYEYARGWAPVRVAYGAQGGETAYDVHADRLGTPRLLTDASEAVVWRGWYSAYGEASVEHPQAGVTPEFTIRFPGQYFDEETGLHYNRFRYYNPEVGRYISADPIGQRGGVNLYSYAANSPTNYTDPLGLFRFGKRPLGGGSAPWVPGASRNPVDDFTNTEVSHEHGFFEDGSGENIGFGPEGRFSEDPAGRGYRYDDEYYDDALMRRALENVSDGDYSLLGWGPGPKNNCQDWADRARDEYNKLLNESGGQSDPYSGPNMTPVPPNMSYGP